ncbi:sensor histidine kinase [Petrocella sp. FN5]|uniref:sensor histidine kinase n=1 Tax=Petrocella sp. FN5 TaxID=3032002 RepID=UPI0023DBAF2D|nr:HAMP domain-containing sensor histidine kinase [Petrocella sp. FN5]MDF1618163.1 HAMP domain-containing sensor histidine kinase [Petrocella sp. FN5]
MFKTFTGRFFAIYAMTTLVIFLLLFGVLTQIISNYFIENHYKMMLEESRILSDQFIETYKARTLTDLNFNYQLTATSRYIDSRIMILDENHRVFKDTQTTGKSLVGHKLNHPIIHSVFEGQQMSETGTFGDLYDQLVLTTAYPIFSGDRIIGAVIINSPYPTLRENINNIYQMTLISLLVLLSATFISTYVYSKSISNTISELNDRVQAIANGDFSSHVVVSTDNEIGQLANNINHMASELEKLEDMRKDFIANISHDFRSPLTSIKGFVQAILDNTIPYERQGKYLNIVLDETERLTKLTNDILLLTKMENNTVQLNKTHYDLHQDIRKILFQFEQKILDKHIDFTLLIDQQELFVFADMNQIQRVLTNLIDNAIKFCSPEDTIIVETTVLIGKVEVRIKDSGPGISEEDIKYIWDRFHKADRSRGKDKKGIGLGLSIVREIIKAHNEKIDVYSQEGKGTTFVFTLPLSHHT